ncbi:MAG: CpaF family protein [Lachnospiraceae bacterium]|nr:CpaF family protein [Lachnospiraceae bacterium]
MLSDKEKEITVTVRKRVLEQLEYERDVSDERIGDLITQYLEEETKNSFYPYHRRLVIGREIFYSLRKLDILQPILENPSVTEIMVNGPNHVFIEKDGCLYKLDDRFESEEKLKNIIQQIVAKCNRVVNDTTPIVDARLEDGSRVNVVLNPVALNGPILTIRRFPKEPYDMRKLVSISSLTEEAAVFLQRLVYAGYNIIISGGTGSGKTTFLNALSGYIPKEERIITIEDSAELQIQGIDNLVRLETKNANTENGKAISIRDLIKASLRMRPSRIIVGEVRGPEAMDMVCSAMNCGHDGSMSTVHANSAGDALLRLETMILMAVQIPVEAIRRQISSGVDIIVHLGRMRDKSRKVLEIIEVTGMDDKKISVNPIFQYEEESKTDTQNVTGSLKRIGELKNAGKLFDAGIGE